MSQRRPVRAVDQYKLKRLANKMDVPYQSLVKTFLAERLKAERKAA
ncbi:MAG: hypothetical protein AAB676_10315 [Verrucomicrobiota bacterium]